MKIQPLLLSAFFTLTSAGLSLAEGPRHVLRGLFCNTEHQLEQTLADPRWGNAPRLAVEITNITGVVCTYVDRLHYVVLQPAVVGRANGYGPLMYEATLTAVIVGGQIREVAPPVQVFFATEQPITGAASRRGI